MSKFEKKKRGFPEGLRNKLENFWKFRGDWISRGGVKLQKIDMLMKGTICFLNKTIYNYLLTLQIFLFFFLQDPNAISIN